MGRTSGTVTVNNARLICLDLGLVVLDTLCKGDKIIMGLIDDVSIQVYVEIRKLVKKVNNNGLFTQKK